MNDCFSNEQWNFTDRNYDLITFSLVLEHIENLDKVFDRACSVLKAGGYIYIGELHPFKQYAGSKARFQTQERETVLPCFTHHISDFIIATKRCGLNLAVIEEFFDGNREGLPRIISMVFQKPVAETSNK